jgi:hypothetical protein
MKSIPERLNHQLTGNSIIAILIAITPFIFYSYLCFPSIKVWETPFFTFTSKYYENVETFAWVFLQKFIFIYLMIIWFMTCKYWWNKAILIPIGMLTYQTINLVNDEVKFKDSGLDAIVVFPLVIVVCFILIKIRNKISFKIELLSLREMVDIEIEKSKEEIAKKIKNND